VAVLGASNYTYAEACWSDQLESRIGAHLRGFEFFQALPSLLVPDKLKIGVHGACRYDPDLNPTYQEMARHYYAAATNQYANGVCFFAVEVVPADGGRYSVTTFGPLKVQSSACPPLTYGVGQRPPRYCPNSHSTTAITATDYGAVRGEFLKFAGSSNPQVVWPTNKMRNATSADQWTARTRRFCSLLMQVTF
jgi:hypothetical protein